MRSHKKTQNKNLYKKQKQKEEQTAHHDYHTMDNHTIYKEEKEKCRTTAWKKKGGKPWDY